MAFYWYIATKTTHSTHSLPLGLGIMPSQTAEYTSMEHRVQLLKVALITKNPAVLLE
jgi:hypothetical protein